MSAEWQWNTWDYVHCVECGKELEKRPTSEPEHFCSITCAYSYGVNFNADRNEMVVASHQRLKVPAWVERFSVELIGDPALDTDGEVIWYDRSVVGEGATLQEALAAAISQAKVYEEDWAIEAEGEVQPDST